MKARRVLVIGIGHLDRGDDAAGRLVAARLRAGASGGGVKVVETDGEAGKLLDLFTGNRDVIIVDAALSGAAPGTIHRLDAAAAALPRPMFAMSSHAIGLVESIELARALGVLPQRCIVFAIEAEQFELGAGISTPVAEAIEEVCRRVMAELPAEAA